MKLFIIRLNDRVELGGGMQRREIEDAREEEGNRGGKCNNSLMRVFFF